MAFRQRRGGGAVGGGGRAALRGGATVGPSGGATHLRLSNDGFGTDDDRVAIWALEDEMESALAEAPAGELDGDEFGQGECVLFLYGPNADRLFAVVEPYLKSSPTASGGFAIKRYGDVSDVNAPTARVVW